MVKPGKLKSGSRNKLKRWAKGGSSSSNPASVKFREKARSSFFQKHSAVKSNKTLTKSRLKQHDELTNVNVDKTAVAEMDVDSENDSNTVETFGTFLSGVSDCTNITFRKIQKYWERNSVQHKEVCAVLAAITEVIREQKGEESDTAYFAALVTALSTVEQAESAAAISYLLSMTVKNVPVQVLRAKFGEVSKLLCHVLGQISARKKKATPAAFMRSIFLTLATLLRHQDISVWEDSSTMTVFHAILIHVDHAKPKVRKAAQDAVCIILHATDFMLDGNTVHPAASTTAEHCIEQLNKPISSSSKCHLLALLGRVFASFTQAKLKKACETVLEVMLLGDTVVKLACLKTLRGVFTTHQAALTPDLNGQIINALYDFYPNAADALGSPIWLNLMEKAVINLPTQFESDNKAVHLVLTHIPKLFESCFKLLLSSNKVVQNASASTAQNLLNKGLASFWKKDVLLNQSNETKFVSDIFKLLEDGLKFKYHSMWNLVFQIIEASFRCIVKPSHFSLVRTVIESLVNLRDTPNFQFRDELDSAAGSMVVALGPKLFLESVPLKIDGSETDGDFPRSWFLPLFKKYIKKAELSFFSDYFLPLICKFRERTEKLESLKRLIEATAYKTLETQCWDILPIFCKEAPDLHIAFPRLAELLGKFLKNCKDLQQVIMLALRNVVLSVKKTGESQDIIARYSKNYLPILFLIYTDPKHTKGISLDEDERMPDSNRAKSAERLASLETIRIFLSVTDPELIQKLYNQAQEKATTESGLTDASRLALFDLMIAMVQYVTEKQVEETYAMVRGLIEANHHSMQKKAYRILQEVCSARTPSCEAFVKSHLKELQDRLLNGLDKAAPSSKGPRIACMEQVFSLLHADPKTRKQSMTFLEKLIPEVILCTKESRRSRIAAFSLLVSSGKCFVTDEDNKVINSSNDNMEEDGKSKLSEYFDIISWGLTQNPMSIRATIVSLSRLVYEFKDKMSPKLFDQVVNNVCLLFGTNTTEVADAAFGFVFVLLHIMAKAHFLQLLPKVFENMTHWKETTRRHFRLRTKHFLKRLVQKYGYETIKQIVPDCFSKYLEYIRKQLSRAKKRAIEQNAEKQDNESDDIHSTKKETMDEILAESSESDLDEEEKEPAKRKKKSGSKHSAWIQERSEEPLDLLDSKVSQNILMSNPKAQKKGKKNEFEIAPDGRLIIHDGNLSEADEEHEKIFKTLGIDKKKAKEGSKLETAKRKLEDSDSENESVPPKKLAYKPGGKGIHRDREDEESGVRFKAKKAGGDVKQKGTHEPYAYLPFNSSILNKRKKKKLTGQYKGLVKAAKKGAATGQKRKFKNRLEK